MVKRAPALSAGLAKSIMSPIAGSTSSLCLGILGSGVSFWFFYVYVDGGHDGLIDDLCKSNGSGKKAC